METVYTSDKIQPPKRFHIRKDKTNPRRLAYLTLLLFADPPDWPLMAIGVPLITASILFHAWAAGYLARAGYAERETILTVRGPYRHNRNPYYVAQMTMDFGFFLVAGQPVFYILYFPLIFSVYRSWVAKEERFLEKEFGDDYRKLKREVPRWSLRIKPADARGSELSFKWTTFMLNRELPRSVSHLFFLVVFVAYFFFGNPFTDTDVLVRVTMIAGIAVWLIVRDTDAVDVSQVSVGWTLLAVTTALITAIFLLKAPVWYQWDGIVAWIGTAAGICLGLLVSASALPRFSGGFGSKRPLFARPVLQLYVFGLALGLLSCTLGGVWLGIMVPFVLWMLNIAGVMAIKAPPKGWQIAFGLLLLSVVLGSVL